MVEIRFSSALQNVTGEEKTNIEANTVKEAINILAENYGEEFQDRLLENGEPKRFVNLYVNGEDIRHLDGLDTNLDQKDEISILPAVSGG